MNNIFYFGVIQSLFFFLLLLFKKNKNSPDCILLFWFLYYSVHLLFPAFVFYNYPANISYSGLDVGFLTLHLVFLDSYISSFSGIRRRLLFSVFLKGGVLAGTVLYVCPFLLMGNDSRSLVMTGQSEFPLMMIFGALILMCTSAFFLCSSYIKLKKFRLNLRQLVSDVYGLTMKWVDVLIFSFSLFFSAILLFFILMLFMPLQPHLADFVIYSCQVVLVFWMGFSAIRQGVLFLPDTVLSEVEGRPEAGKTPEEKDLIFAESLRRFTLERKVYLDSELRMSRMARMLSVSPQYLSYVLNRVIGLSFYDFINSFRIGDVCNRIQDGDAREHTILTLAFESGFNSKATFNRLFKKHTGMSPSEYAKNCLK